MRMLYRMVCWNNGVCSLRASTNGTCAFAHQAYAVRNVMFNLVRVECMCEFLVFWHPQNAELCVHCFVFITK
jgi:hypothetical protein